MQPQNKKMVKTTTPIHKMLLDEIDQFNPFKTRREFFEEACQYYLAALKRKLTDQKLEEACKEAAEEDLLENDDWEQAALEGWR